MYLILGIILFKKQKQIQIYHLLNCKCFQFSESDNILNIFGIWIWNIIVDILTLPVINNIILTWRTMWTAPQSYTNNQLDLHILDCNRWKQALRWSFVFKLITQQQVQEHSSSIFRLTARTLNEKCVQGFDLPAETPFPLYNHLVSALHTAKIATSTIQLTYSIHQSQGWM